MMNLDQLQNLHKEFRDELKDLKKGEIESLDDKKERHVRRYQFKCALTDTFKDSLGEVRATFWSHKLSGDNGFDYLEVKLCKRQEDGEGLETLKVVLNDFS